MQAANDSVIASWLIMVGILMIIAVLIQLFVAKRGIGLLPILGFVGFLIADFLSVFHVIPLPIALDVGIAAVSILIIQIAIGMFRGFGTPRTNFWL